MSWICHDPPFVFFHNPRTAGTSMIEAMRRQCDLQPYHSHNDAPLAVKDHSREIPDEAKDYPRFCGLRNPYARELSFYLWNQRHLRSQHPLHLIASRYSFVEYMRHRVLWRHDSDFCQYIFGPQTLYWRGLEPTPVRFEELPDSFDNMREAVGLAVTSPLSISGATVSPDYRLEDHYDDEAMELVRIFAGNDFIRCHYDPWVLPGEDSP